MHITQTHLNFWLSKRAPKWSAGINPKNKTPAPSIHDCINAHVPKQTGFTGLSERVARRENDNAVHNLVNILRIRARTAKSRKLAHILCPEIADKETTVEFLARLAHNPGTVCSPEKRAAYARKWHIRLTGKPPEGPSYADIHGRRTVSV